MRPTGHLKLLLMGPLFWFGFWVLGLPDYYQQYPTWLLAIGCALLVPPFWWFGVRTIGRAAPERRVALGAWLAFYFTVPFAALDSLYCGVYLAHGIGFFAKYWYLTLFYVLPWLMYPPYAWWSLRR